MCSMWVFDPLVCLGLEGLCLLGSGFWDNTPVYERVIIWVAVRALILSGSFLFWPVTNNFSVCIYVYVLCMHVCIYAYTYVYMYVYILL